MRTSSLEGFSKESLLKLPDRTVSDQWVKPHIVGAYPAGIIQVPALDTTWTLKDTLGAWKVRWGISRKTYEVPSGLYAVGAPNEESPVIATANYKLTVDHVRRVLKGENLWLLVLDTHGINVWCAAGKGTFSSKELIRQIYKTDLTNVISHKEIIVPQLGAPGIEPHKIKEIAGFDICYAPIRASDLPVWLHNGRKASEAMRRISFNLGDRMELVPVEMVGHVHWAMMIVMFLGAMVWFKHPNDGMLSLQIVRVIKSVAVSWLVGSVLNPMLLPWLPFRWFSANGALLGFAGTAVLLTPELLSQQVSAGVSGALCLIAMGFSGIIALNFTGCTTYTSYSSVKYETERALIGCGITALAGFVAYGFFV